MSQPYGGQQPPQYPQNPSGGGFPQAPGYGMPQAPQEYASGPIPRPGVTTTAAVLAYVQAGITTITTILVWTGVFNLEGSALVIQLLVAVAQTAGVILLITGGVQIMSGKSRTMLVVAAGVELAICLFYLVVYSLLDTGGIDVLEGAKTVLIVAAVFFAVMPTVALVMAFNAQTTQFLQSRRLPRQ